MKYTGIISGIVTVLIVALLLSGCKKETTELVGGTPHQNKSVTLTQEQARRAQEMYAKMPRIKFYDSKRNQIIERKAGSRDLIFSDPDEGFSFSDPDNNGAMVFSDSDGDYLMISYGFGVSGQGGGGTVIAGSSALTIDIAICFTLEAVASGDGFGDLFSTGIDSAEYGAIFGISGDFEALQDADADTTGDFDPFGFLHGFAAYYVFADELDGSHEVFDWMDYDMDDNYDDLASSFVMDFQTLALYFSNGGTINVSGGSMSFNGTYLAITDLFESFLEDGLGQDEPTVEEVTGYGSMGCN